MTLNWHLPSIGEFMQPTTSPSTSLELGYTTAELAHLLRLDPGTLRKSHSQKGSYYGVRPEKIPNGQLRWPLDAVAQLLNARCSK
tara:strand:+ start:840 stop:1094 length:255 start_codon:yes stop_codon:yes gene_type:complete